MWLFKKREPKVLRPEWVEELTHNIQRPITKEPNYPYVIQVGIGHYTNRPDLFRVFYRMSQNNGGDVTILPRIQFMERHRALVVADAWAKALEVTYDMSLEQMECDLD